MAYKEIYVFVEGDDDKRFFETVIQPRLPSYDHVMIYDYRRKKKKQVADFLRSVISMGAEYVFVADMDECPRISDRVASMKDRYPETSVERIQVVVREIESWYLAGASNTFLADAKVRCPSPRVEVSKEEFEGLFAHCLSAVEVKLKILEDYQIELALGRNASLKYFFDTFGSSLAA